VQKAFSEVVKDQKLKVAGYPRIERKEAGDERELAFQRDFRDLPRSEAGRRSRSEDRAPTHPVEDADVDRTIEILRKQRVSWEAVARASQTATASPWTSPDASTATNFPEARAAGWPS